MNMLENKAVFLTIFVACRNEADNISATFDTLKTSLSSFNFSHEVIVIDDASTDESVQVIRNYMISNPSFPIKLVERETNKGLAQNYIEAAFIGKGEWYRLVCGDNVEPAETLITIFKRIGEADMIIPYQVECVGKSITRTWISRIFTLLVNSISGYKIKYYNGLAVHRRYNVQRWHTNYRGFGFQADMITRLLDEGMSYIEVPVIAHERSFGKSTALNKKNFLSVAHTLLDLLIRRVGKLFFTDKPVRHTIVKKTTD